MNWAAIVWFILMVVMILVETGTVCLVSIWFVAGALVAMIASFLGAQLWLQVVLFFLVSVALLLLLRPLIKKHITPKQSKTNIDAVIGTTGIVTAPINNVMATGTVKIGAMQWSARSTSGAEIGEGTLITVDRIEGVKLFVTPAEVKETV